MWDLHELQQGACVRYVQQSMDPYHPLRDMYDPPLLSVTVEVKVQEEEDGSAE